MQKKAIIPINILFFYLTHGLMSNIKNEQWSIVFYYEWN